MKKLTLIFLFLLLFGCVSISTQKKCVEVNKECVRAENVVFFGWDIWSIIIFTR